MLCACPPANGQTSPTLSRRLDLDARETYIQFWPADSFLYIKEYYLSTLKSEPADIRRQVAQISDLVRSANYSNTRSRLKRRGPRHKNSLFSPRVNRRPSARSNETQYKTRYGLQVFTPMEEHIFRDRRFVTVECRLLTKERNLRTVMNNVYASLLNRHVAITIAAHDIGLHFEGPDITAGGSNAKGVFCKENKRAIFWRNGDRFYEAVFARQGADEKDLRSIVPYVERDVASPTKSAAEIEAWKKAK